MRVCKHTSYPELRRAYSTMEELGKVINRSDRYVKTVLSGKKPFTAMEWDLIKKDLERRKSHAEVV